MITTMTKVAAAALVVLLTGLAAHADAAQTDPAFSVTAVVSGRPSEGSGYLQLTAQPGESRTEALVVRNLQDQPIELSLMRVDASTGPVGGASYGRVDDAAAAVGRWISVEPSSLSLAPGASGTASVRVSVPADARSGDHLGGVVVAPPPPADSPNPSTAAVGASVRVGVRRVVAVEVKVPGPADPALTVRGVSPAARPSGGFLLVNIANTGRALTTADGFIELPGLGFRKDFHVDTFVPGTAISYPVSWTARPPDGRWPARVELRFGTDRAVWEGEVVVGRGIAAELDRRRVDGAASARPAAAPSVPWPLIAGGWACAATGGFLLARRRRRPAHGADGRPGHRG